MFSYNTDMSRGSIPLLIILVIVGLFLYATLMGAFNNARKINPKVFTVPEAEKIYRQ